MTNAKTTHTSNTQIIVTAAAVTPESWADYAVEDFPFLSSTWGHAGFLCSPPQREQICWNRHGTAAHDLPSFQAKQEMTRLLFGRGLEPLSGGPWVDLGAPPKPENLIQAPELGSVHGWNLLADSWVISPSPVTLVTPWQNDGQVSPEINSLAWVGTDNNTSIVVECPHPHPSRSVTGRSLCAGSGLLSSPSRERRSSISRLSSDNAAMSTKSLFWIRHTNLAGTTGRVSPSWNFAAGISVRAKMTLPGSGATATAASEIEPGVPAIVGRPRSRTRPKSNSPSLGPKHVVHTTHHNKHLGYYLTPPRTR